MTSINDNNLSEILNLLTEMDNSLADIQDEVKKVDLKDASTSAIFNKSADCRGIVLEIETILDEQD